MRFVSHARTVAALTFISRVTGLVRDAALSRVFGAGALMDAFFFAFLVPNLFRRLFGEGALAAAFLPAYARLDRTDPRVARHLARLTLGILAAGLGTLVAVAEVVLLAVAGAADDAPLALRLTIVLLPYMPMVCLVAILGAVLQVHDRFGPTAAAPVVLNLAIIAAATGGGVLLDGAPGGERHITIVAASVVAAGLIQVGWSFAALRRMERPASLPPPRPASASGGGGSDATRDALRRVLRQALPMILGLGVLQLNTFFDSLIASYPSIVGPTLFGVAYPLEEGAMAAVSFAQRLYQFPLGVFGIALATAIFPALARQSDDDAGFRATVQRGLRLVFFVGLPASVGLALVRVPLTRVILEGGAFTPEDAAAVGFVLLGYASAVWAYSAIHILTRAFYAQGDSRTPVKVALAMVGFNLALNCTLIWTPLREAGLAWSTAICAIIQTALLTRHIGAQVGPIFSRPVRRSLARSVGVTAVMGAAVAGVLAVLRDASSWGGALAQLAAAVAIGLLVVAAGARLRRMPELGWLMRRS